ncbi:putative reverse transcriptase domain-containing protein [Tanacetum coccineum]
MEHGFLNQKGSRGGRGVKEKNLNALNKDDVVPFVTVASGINVVLQEENLGQSSTSPTPNESGPDVLFASLLKGESKRKGLNFHTLITQARNRADVAILLDSIRVVGESSMDGLDSMLENGPWFIRNNLLILKNWNQNVNLMKEDVVNVSVWVKLYGVPVTAFTADGLSVIAMKIGTYLMLDSYTFDMCIQSWGRSSYARALIEIQADVELKDTIVVAMPKIIGEGFYTATIRVEYEWKPLRCASCKVFRHGLDECPKNTDSGRVKNVKKLSQASRGVLVRPKVGFKPTKQVFRVVPKQTNANTSGGSSNMASKKDNTSGSSFGNVDSSSISTTPIHEKIDKIEKLIFNGKVKLVDDEGKHVKKIDYLGDHDSRDEVASTDNIMANILALEKVGYGTNSLLEQWKESYGDGDYDFDLYDDDMYDGQDIPDKIQDICIKLDIKSKLVARGFTQMVGFDYNEVFSSVIRHTSIWVILALTACKDYELEQFDVKMAFLYGNLEEMIYMRQPAGYEQCNKAEIGSTKSLLQKDFDMKELGEANKILGMETVRDQSRKIMSVSQSGDYDVERMSKVPYCHTLKFTAAKD